MSILHEVWKDSVCHCSRAAYFNSRLLLNRPILFSKLCMRDIFEIELKLETFNHLNYFKSINTNCQLLLRYET